MIWRHCRHSDPGWIAPPIRPDMIFGKDSDRNAWKHGRYSAESIKLRRYFQALARLCSEAN
jgi:hypothetical protein